MVKINWIEYKELDSGLTIEHTEFNDNVTLLVGKSGAGKTRILKAIQTLCSIATNCFDNRLPPINAKVCFSIDTEDRYTWEIKTEREADKETTMLPDLFFDEDIPFILGTNIENAKRTVFVSEKMTLNRKIIFKRDKKGVVSFGDYKRKMPTPKNDSSLISLYQDDSLITQIYSHMNSIYQIKNNDFNSMPSSVIQRIGNSFEDFKNLEINEYRKKFPHTYPLTAKIYLLKNTNDYLYQAFINNFKAIFPDVENIAIKEASNESQQHNICITTNDIDIPYSNISSGMKKTMHFLCDMLTISNDNIILIDEYENSLGVNCLEEVLEFIFSLRRDLQYIVTSHHPYIIHNINRHQCKIVQRSGSVITVTNADKLIKVNNQHDFFDELLDMLKRGEKN